MPFQRIHTASGSASQIPSIETVGPTPEELTGSRANGTPWSESTLRSQEGSHGLGSTICDYISSFLNAICNCLAKIPCLGCLFTHSEMEVEQISEIVDPRIKDQALKLMWNLICTQYSTAISGTVLGSCYSPAIDSDDLDPEMSAEAIRTLLKTKPAWIQQVKKLDLGGERGRRLQILPPEIGLFTSLEDLELDENRLTKLPPEIAQLKSLQRLGFTNNECTILPPVITQLTSLRQLDIFHNLLTELPPEIAQLTLLEELDMENNLVKIFPSAITQLTSLKRLDLTLNRLSALHPNIAQLRSLEELCLGENSFLGKNSFEVFPPEIERLVSLKTLSFTPNELIPQRIRERVKLIT